MFFDTLNQYEHQLSCNDVFVNDEGELVQTSYTFNALAVRTKTACEQIKQHLPDAAEDLRYVVIIKMHGHTDSVIDYLAALQSHIVAILVDPNTSSEALRSLVERFEVNAIFDASKMTVLHSKPKNVDPRVALLLPTSGSTGAAKNVALSYTNLQANAESICEYLPILPTDTAINTLPLFYSYGLSVLNSHLLRGACVVFSDYSVVNREFWQIMQGLQISSFAGVPHFYNLLSKLRFVRRDLPALRYFTQAGGKLPPNLVTEFSGYAQQKAKQFFIMYGQTEATARMAFLSPDKLSVKPTSIGQPIANGRFKIVEDELLYQGPNVMLGYCSSAVDLIQLAPLDWLETGDLARVDEEGDYYIVGRKKRFLKLLGYRVDLDSAEQQLANIGFEAACCGNDERLIVLIALTDDAYWQSAKATVQSHLQHKMNLHHSVTTLMYATHLPLTSNGKRDYPSITRMAEVWSGDKHNGG